jgi:hypothetical protein
MSEEEVAKPLMGITKGRLRELSGLFNLYSAGGIVANSPLSKNPRTIMAA